MNNQANKTDETDYSMSGDIKMLKLQLLVAQRAKQQNFTPLLSVLIYFSGRS